MHTPLAVYIAAIPVIVGFLAAIGRFVAKASRLAQSVAQQRREIQALTKDVRGLREWIAWYTGRMTPVRGLPALGEDGEPVEVDGMPAVMRPVRKRSDEET